ncbi:hypothetical protein PC116_g34530, partial [Phytophthora cactorum]
MSSASRSKLSNRLKAVIATHDAQYEEAKTVEDVNQIHLAISKLEQIVDMSRINGEAFLADFIQKQVTGRRRFRFVSQLAGNERFIGVLAEAFNATIGHLILVLLFNRLLEIENKGIAPLLQAEIEYLESLRKQEELWGEFDLFRVSWSDIGDEARDVITRRVRLR